MKKIYHKTTGKFLGYRQQYTKLDGKPTTKTTRTKKELSLFLAEHAIAKAAQKVNGKPHEAYGLTLKDAIARYRDTGLGKLKNAEWTHNACNRLMTYDIARVPLVELSLRHAEQHIVYREELDKVGGSAIIREFTVLKTVLRLCRKWYGLVYPWTELKMPGASPARTRLITPREEQRMMKAVGIDLDSDAPIETANQRSVAAFLVACDNGMRLGELAGLTFGMVNWDDQILELPSRICKGKKGANSSRDAIIPEVTQRILSKLSHLAGEDDALVFGLSSETMGTLFRRVRNATFSAKDFKKNGSFTFHDARHLAVTRLSKLVSMLELAKIIGHKNLNELMTYYEGSGADIAATVRAKQQAAKA